MKNEKLNCIGYKNAFTGEKMWYYKLEKDNVEYLIVDTTWLLDMKWENNDFGDADFSDDFLDEIKKEIETLPKVEKELSEDEEKNFFTKHEIKEVVEEEFVRVDGVYSDDEINDILDILQDNDYIYNENTYKTITADVFEDYDNYKELIGYKVKYETDGDHKNDGQMVEYDFTFVSPSGKNTYFGTEMCLMVGWNYYEKLKIL